MARWIDVLERVTSRVSKSVVIRHHPRLRHQRIRGDEGAQGGVVESGVVEHQPRAVLLLAGVGAVRGQGVGAAATHVAILKDLLLFLMDLFSESDSVDCVETRMYSLYQMQNQIKVLV